jgi:O-antigen/teichoic acid export membrane protein
MAASHPSYLIHLYPGLLIFNKAYIVSSDIASHFRFAHMQHYTKLELVYTVEMMHHVNRIRNFPHTRNVVINTLGNYIGYAFTAFYIIFFVRVFDPVEFGVLTVLQALSYLLANILSFGIPASIYAHIPQYLPDKKKAFDFITSNFIFLTILSGASLVLIYLFAEQLDAAVFKTGAPSSYYLYALLGTQMYIWQNFIRDVMNAADRFLHINIAANLSNVVKVGLLVYLALHGALGIPEVLLITGLVGPAVVFAYILLERAWIVKAFLSSRATRSEIRFKYTFLYFLSTQIFNIATRADLFMVSFFLTRPEVGYYGLSQRVILAVVTSSDSITQVMSPQFAKISSQRDVMRLLKHSYVYMLVPTAMFIGGIIMPSSIYELVFSQTYTASTLLTRALSLAYLPYSFLAALLLFFLYTIKKPMYLLISNLIFLVCILIGNFLLIQNLRVLAPAISYLAAFIIILTYLGYAFKKELQRLPA